MPGIVEFPHVVRDAMAQYGGLFANDDACNEICTPYIATGSTIAINVAAVKTSTNVNPRDRFEFRS